MGERRHYTEDTAESCWLCSPEERCHVHDPRERKRLAVWGEDAFYEGGEGPERLAWSVER